MFITAHKANLIALPLVGFNAIMLEAPQHLFFFCLCVKTYVQVLMMYSDDVW